KRPRPDPARRPDGPGPVGRPVGPGGHPDADDAGAAGRERLRRLREVRARPGEVRALAARAATEGGPYGQLPGRGRPPWRPDSPHPRRLISSFRTNTAAT